MDLDGKNIRQVTNTDIPKFDLQWLPGGEQLLYGQGKCVYRIEAFAPGAKPEELTCFNSEKFYGFRVSPDGAQVAVSIENRLIVVPYDVQWLPNVKTAFELQSSEDACIDYSRVTVRGAQWSADGKSLAILYQSVIGKTYGETVRVITVDLQRCKEVDPLITDEFPAKQFLPEGYAAHPVLPSYAWNGADKFLFNTYKRNDVYGELYLYDVAAGSARKINPVKGVCCYHGAVFSPDGSYVLLFFQDESRGSDSETQLYYLALDQIGASATPIKLPVRFFPKPRENLQAALHPVNP
jgi:Tol biopolymer transport system component